MRAVPGRLKESRRRLEEAFFHESNPDLILREFRFCGSVNALAAFLNGMADGTGTCSIALEADLESPAQLDVDSAELIAAAESYLTAELGRVFWVTARAGEDAIEVGRAAIRGFHSWEAWQRYGFAALLKDVQADFRVKVKLSHSPRDPALE